MGWGLRHFSGSVNDLVNGCKGAKTFGVHLRTMTFIFIIILTYSLFIQTIAPFQAGRKAPNKMNIEEPLSHQLFSSAYVRSPSTMQTDWTTQRRTGSQSQSKTDSMICLKLLNLYSYQNGTMPRPRTHARMAGLTAGDISTLQLFPTELLWNQDFLQHSYSLISASHHRHRPRNANIYSPTLSPKLITHTIPILQTSFQA